MNRVLPIAKKVELKNCKKMMVCEPKWERMWNLADAKAAKRPHELLAIGACRVGAMSLRISLTLPRACPVSLRNGVTMTPTINIRVVDKPTNSNGRSRMETFDYHAAKNVTTDAPAPIEDSGNKAETTQTCRGLQCKSPIKTRSIIYPLILSFSHPAL